MKTGTLYIVATPIGNLEDITFRAIKTLKEVDLILAEDTRVTKTLLIKYEIVKPMISYHQQSSDSKKAEIMNQLILGKNIALVTDAGTPGISDPGNELVSYLIQNTIYDIQAIPGPSSITSALSVCGFDVSKFTFIGFWPKKKSKKTLDFIKQNNLPVVFFESPFRIIKTLELLEVNFRDKQIFVAQELTKLHERTLRGPLSDIRLELEKEKKELGRVKGEIVCILNS
jgi:16S rRNA (cytidine1402-2'-O)-methyltransferase